MEHAPDSAVVNQAKAILTGLRGHYDAALKACGKREAEGMNAAELTVAFQGCFKDEAICCRPKAKGKKAIESAVAKLAARFGNPEGFTFGMFVMMACSSAIKMGLTEEIAVELRVLVKVIARRKRPNPCHPMK